MSSDANRGRLWLHALARADGVAWQSTDGRRVPSVIFADADLAEELVRFISVVVDAENRFPRARHGEVGLDEGWALAEVVRDAMKHESRPIVAVVDVPSQAYGRQEEIQGLHRACAAAVAAYAEARLAGHPVVALLVGKAMSGAFLAHGLQANRILALDDPEVMVHAMAKDATARVTRRSVQELEKLGETILPMSYAVGSFARIGMVDRLIDVSDADAPTNADLTVVRDELATAIQEIRASGKRDLSHRLESEQAKKERWASLEVRRRMTEQWE